MLIVLIVFFYHCHYLRSSDYQGFSPLDIASKNGHLEVVKFLFNRISLTSRRVIFDPVQNIGKSPIHLAAENGHLNLVVYYLIQQPFLLNQKDQNGDTPLCKAAAAGRADVVQYLINNGAVVNVQNNEGETPLHAAALHNQPEIVKILIESGDNGQTKDNNGNLAIHSAAASGNVESLRKLVDLLPLSVGFRNNFADTPLCLAAQHGHIEVMKMLVEEKHVHVDDKCNHGYTAFLVAIAQNQQEAAAYLLDHGADVDAVSNDENGGSTALHIAAADGIEPMVRFVIGKNPRLLGNRNLKGNTPFWVAASTGNMAGVKLLLELGSDLNSRGEGNLTPFLAAAKYNQPEIIEYLLQIGVPMNQTTVDDHRDEAIHLASLFGNIATVQFLLRKDFRLLSKPNAQGETSIWKASYGGKTDTIEFLLQQGASVEEGNNAGLTPLHAAVERGLVNVVDFLIAKGAKLDKLTGKKSGQLTAMHLAVVSGSLEVLRGLYNLDSSMLEMKNGNGETPLWYASYIGENAAVKFLLDLGANKRSRCNEGWTPLIAAASRDRIGVIDTLYKYAVDFNESTSDEASLPIHIAAGLGNLEAVKLMSQIRFYSDRQNNLGETPLWMAAYGGHGEIVHLLAENKSCSIESVGRHGWTPLLAAIDGGHLSVVYFLVHKGANLMAQAHNGYSPIHLAAAQGYTDIVKFLIGEQDSLLELSDNETQTPLIVALNYSQNEVTRLLLRLGANKEVRSHSGQTAAQLG